MIKQKAVFIICLLSCLFMLACGSNSAGQLDDSYHAGTDFQYFETPAAAFPGTYVQETETGCVFLHDSFIYTYDQESGSILPLCSRVNCLHDRETDPDKLTSCNAHIDHLVSTVEFDYIHLMLYKEYLYAAYHNTDKPPEMPDLWTVYRIALDGSSKDEVFRTVIIQQPMIHRGYMYYYTQNYEVKQLENGEGITSIGSEVTLHRMELESGKYKDEVLPVPNAGEITGLGSLRAFGNHLYFTVGEDNSIEHPLVYNIITGEFEDTNVITSITFCNGEVYTGSYGYPYNIREEGEINASDYLLKEPHAVLTQVPKDSHVVSDRKRIYVHNIVRRWMGPDTEIRYLVYDTDMTLIDEFTLPETMKYTKYPMEPPIGGEKYQYVEFDDPESGEWGLYVWDKSSIGTLHGKAYEQTKIVYRGNSSPEDPQEGNESSSGNEEEITDEYEAELSEWTEEYAEYQPRPDEDPARIVMTDAEVTVTFENEAEPSRKELVLTVWYIKDNTVRCRTLRAEKTNADSSGIKMTLPKGGERFIGARLNSTYYFLRVEVDASGKEVEYEVIDGPKLSAYTGRIKRK